MANATYHHLYCTAAWRRARAAQLRREPLCRMHREQGQTVAGQAVDHVKPHRGDLELFFAEGNLQTLCSSCHSSHKQAQEYNADGILRGAGLNGRPLDLAHPWHSAQGRGGQKSETVVPQTGLCTPLAEPRNGQGGVR